MDDFKIGDEVICIDNGNPEQQTYLTLGKIYKITDYWQPSGIFIIDDTNQKGQYFSYRFKKDINVKVYGIVMFCASLNKEKK